MKLGAKNVQADGWLVRIGRLAQRDMSSWRMRRP